MSNELTTSRRSFIKGAASAGIAAGVMGAASALADEAAPAAAGLGPEMVC